jgi:spermidine synthase
MTKVIRSIESNHNGTMEIVMRGGKKMLDSPNANYSYGAAHDLWKIMLSKTPLKNVKSILILGLGGGTILKLLRDKFKYEGKILAVELDEIIIQLAREEFGVVADVNTKIVCDDAIHYISSKKTKFDIILVDISIDFDLPKAFLSVKFWNDLTARLHPCGRVIFNALDQTRSLTPIKKQILSQRLDWKMWSKVNGTNNVVVISM